MPIDVMPKEEAAEKYIGDGLFASFDGFQIKLRAPRLYGENVIYLEPDVYNALTQFARNVWSKTEEV